MLFFGLVLLNTGGGILFLLFSVPFIGYGIYVLKRPTMSSALTVQEIEEEKAALKAEDALPADVESLYWRAWREYVRTMGLNGPAMLERRIHDYMSQGISKEEAIRRLTRTEKIH
jgi:hypothetical protein